MSENKSNITIQFSMESMSKIRNYLDIASEKEWLGLLVIDKADSGQFRIKDVLLPPQEVSPSKCEITDSFDDWIEKKLKDNPSDIANVCGMIHSHGTGQVFFSGTDDDMNTRLMKYISKNTICIAVVVNKDMDFKSMMMVKLPYGEFAFEDVPVTTYINGKDTEELCRKEFEKNVKESTSVWANYNKDNETKIETICPDTLSGLRDNINELSLKIYEIENGLCAERLSKNQKKKLNGKLIKLHIKRKKLQKRYDEADFYNIDEDEESHYRNTKDLPAYTLINGVMYRV